MNSTSISQISQAGDIIDPEIKHNINIEVDAIAGAPIDEILTYFVNLKAAYDALEKKRKEIYHALDRINKGVIPERLAEIGTDKVRVPELGMSFYILTKLSASLIDKEKGMEWLRENGGEDLINDTVNASSLSGFVKSMIEDQGMDPPPEIVRVNLYNQTGMSKYTPK